MPTDITYLGTTITVTGTLTEGVDYGYYYTDGSPWIIDSGSGVEITAKTPATTTNSSGHVVNGSMVNPTSNTFTWDNTVTLPNVSGILTTWKHGWDERLNLPGYIAYDATYNATLSLPITLNAGDSLVCFESYLPDEDPALTADNAGYNLQFTVFTIVSSAPSATALRPCFNWTDKTILGTVNHSKSPSLDKTLITPNDPRSAASTGFFIDTTPTATGGYAGFGRTTADVRAICSLDRPWYVGLSAGSDITLNWLAPRLNQQSYPRDSGGIIARASLYSLFDFDNADHVRARICQLGHDAFKSHTQTCTATDVPIGSPLAGAGYWNGFLWSIIYAGYFLENEDMLNVLTQGVLKDSLDAAAYEATDGTVLTLPFATTARARYSASGFSGYKLPRPRSSYPNGIPLYGDQHTNGPPPTATGNSFDLLGKFDGMAGYGTDGTEMPQPGYAYSQLDANGSMHNATTYMQTASTFMPAYLAARLLGIADKFANPAFNDWCDRWLEDPGMWSSFGNGFMAADPSYTDVGTVNALSVTVPFKFNNDADIGIKVVAGNTITSTTPTLSVNGSTPKTISRPVRATGWTPLVNTGGSESIKSGTTYFLRYSQFNDGWILGSEANISYRLQGAFHSDINGFGGTGNNWVRDVYFQLFKSRQNAGAACL